MFDHFYLVMKGLTSHFTHRFKTSFSSAFSVFFLLQPPLSFIDLRSSLILTDLFYSQMSILPSSANINFSSRINLYLSQLKPPEIHVYPHLSCNKQELKPYPLVLLELLCHTHSSHTFVTLLQHVLLNL